MNILAQFLAFTWPVLAAVGLFLVAMCVLSRLEKHGIDHARTRKKEKDLW